MKKQITTAEINACNKKFWHEQTILMEKRMADDAVREIAFESLEAERKRGVPLYYQGSIEGALEEAEKAKKILLKQRARKGGKAEKDDALQLFILKIARLNQEITTPQLLEKIKAYKLQEPIVDVDQDTIVFRAYGRKDKYAPISGLKDRLSRAKKKLKSR